MLIMKDGNTNRNKRFEYLCSLTQKDLKKVLIKELLDLKREVVSGDGYIFSDGELPIIVCAHMDTVHKKTPEKIFYKDGKISSPEGIGGDDRCGIYMAMKIAKKLDVKIAFFEDEESGGVGSNKFIDTELCNSLIGKVNYVIELDRMNSNDAVFYNCDNIDFENFITKEFWETSYGSFTDICNICPVLGVAGVNLSCGYYKQHTTNEYVDLKEMDIALMEVIKLIRRTKETDKYEYIEYEGKWWSKDYDKYLNKYYQEKYGYYRYDDYGYGCDYLITYYDDEPGTAQAVVDGSSEAEALGHFFMDHPTRCYNDIIEVSYF